MHDAIRGISISSLKRIISQQELHYRCYLQYVKISTHVYNLR